MGMSRKTKDLLIMTAVGIVFFGGAALAVAASETGSTTLCVIAGIVAGVLLPALYWPYGLAGTVIIAIAILNIVMR